MNYEITIKEIKEICCAKCKGKDLRINVLESDADRKPTKLAIICAKCGKDSYEEMSYSDYMKFTGQS